MNSIESLPAEDVLFNHIFPLLEPDDWISLASTNNQFRNIVKFFVRVNKVLVISQHSKISPASFMFLTENATNLRTLRLVSCSWINNKLLKPVLHNNSKLTTVDISDCENFTEGILQILTVQCPHISRMSLRSCQWLENEALDYMAYHRHLKKEVREVPNTEDILQAMGKGLRTNLKANTKGKYQGKDHFYHSLQLKNIKTRAPTHYSKMHPHLLEIDISDCQMLKDENIANFVKVFNHLQVLKIGNNSRITDLTMKAIATNLKDLQMLDISRCHKISNAGLFTVAKYCKKLKLVEIGEVRFPPNLISLIQNNGIRIQRGLPDTPTRMEISQDLDVLSGPGSSLLVGLK